MILHGRSPEELPSKTLGSLSEDEEVFAALTGPDRGLTTVNLKQRHLSISDPDVDYIDILDQTDQNTTGEFRKPWRSSCLTEVSTKRHSRDTSIEHRYYLS